MTTSSRPANHTKVLANRKATQSLSNPLTFAPENCVPMNAASNSHLPKRWRSALHFGLASARTGLSNTPGTESALHPTLAKM